MGFPAARIGDFHLCPMVTVLVPHVGGPVIGPPTAPVLIQSMPAATMGHMCTCVGPPDMIAKGSTGVFIGKKPAARVFDMTTHGGFILLGCFTVLIGETGSGGGGGGGSAGAGMKPKLNLAVSMAKVLVAALKVAAAKKEGLAPKSNKDDFKAQFTLVDEANKSVSGTKYRIETSDGKIHNGTTDGSGKTNPLTGYMPGDCRVSFLNS